MSNANVIFLTQWNPAKQEFRLAKLFHRVMIFIVVSLPCLPAGRLKINHENQQIIFKTA